MIRTPLCDLLGIDAPIVQAPVGSAASPELVAAVANAGGLGMLALTWTPPDRAGGRIRRIRELTDGAFGVNLVLDFPVDDQLAAVLGDGVRIVSTFWGDPTAAGRAIHAAGGLHLHTVGSVREARQAVDAGVDVVVAQGFEAGGHVRGEVATMALVPAVVDAVTPVPVIAAGGIADGRGLVAALALGAQAVWLGTRFLTAVEARTHATYRRRLIDADGADAVHTRCFDGGWPDAPHRALINATIRAWAAAGSPPRGQRPGERDVVATDAGGGAYPRYDATIPLPGMTGAVEEMALYAGQSAGLIGDEASAGDLVRRIVAEATDTIGRLDTLTRPDTVGPPGGGRSTRD
jgi:NAD(P)H-dependent flavin oxidoreductase YrpB (nitropropane dioxygenase family)